MVEKRVQPQDIIRKSFKAEYKETDFLGEGAFGEVYAVVRLKD